MNEKDSLFEEETRQETPVEEESVVEETPAEETTSIELPQETAETEEATQEAPEEEIPQEAPEAEGDSEEIISVEQPEEPAETEISTEEAPAGEESQEAPESEETAETPAEEEAAPEEENPLDLAAKIPPYHERYYLKYREGKRTEALDLAGTKTFLEALGFDGGELRQARKGKDFAETFRSADGGKAQMYCSYCGAEIAGVEYDRLPDGRVRCTSCSNTLVKTKAEVEELCKRVVSNMQTFFGATIDVPVSIEVTDERKLKKRVGVPLGTKDEQSLLILGVAISKKKKYSIILENGAPRISLIATFAHELTHIWQYTHWDDKKGFKKCSKDKRLLIYEGMAKWAELQYLYLIGEANVAKREEFITRNRQDEYGIGFCLYEDRYPLSREAMTCEETPFTPDRYPFDDQQEE